ncbi:hypothetical protein N7509_010259 [Penicillium cosmopolitanum]|uniref:Yeast cell wall synthesis Kre9/Knh1-like N-terminal domain-containing protein n=1 Tax=Penicillium cosmopolitanum TaxID=1131564 RepID=A0A9W9VR00_9EURO|nr:uncharacterized protein N7509_010259 [Penicillium cosmopolitanum]KAJ5387718.1 hypothetical protein N7509_010259 [Penicillium cosmopolitanum]
MRTTILSFLIAFTATAAGLVITSPTVGQNVDNSKSVTVKWHAVETDPDTFSIYLINQNVYPPTQELVASDVPKSKGSYTINAKSIDGVDTGRGYQVNFVSDTDTQAILAQSSQFKVADHADLTASSGKETATATDYTSATDSLSITDFTSATDSTSAASETTSLSATTSMTSLSASTTTDSSTASSTSPTTTHTSTTTEPWDLLLLLQPKPNTTEDPIPTSLRTAIKAEYKIPTGIPSKLITSYATRNKVLQDKASSIPLTGSLERHLASGSKSTSQNLEISPSLVSFMEELSKTHPGPVTMLNLLHFQQPGGKQSYYQYGQAFVPVAGKRGGDAKLVGNVVTPQLQHSSKDPSSSSRAAVAEEWWNEISLVHYPSIRHFCDMLAGDDYQAINEKYRLS